MECRVKLLVTKEQMSMQLYIDASFHALFFLNTLHRSLLANTIQPTDVHDLGKHLVIVCKKVTEEFLTIAGVFCFLEFSFDLVIFVHYISNRSN